MFGNEENLGIIPRINACIFEGVNNIVREETNMKQFLLTVSYLEIYNDIIRDLLNPTEKELRIREHPDLGIYVQVR